MCVAPTGAARGGVLRMADAALAERGLQMQKSPLVDDSDGKISGKQSATSITLYMTGCRGASVSIITTVIDVIDEQRASLTCSLPEVRKRTEKKLLHFHLRVPGVPAWLRGEGVTSARPLGPGHHILRLLVPSTALPLPANPPTTMRQIAFPDHNYTPNPGPVTAPLTCFPSTYEARRLVRCAYIIETLGQKTLESGV